ncbi:MAG: hypothetical protein KatS3mg074_593 [Meiothermus sp.]|uniref:Uncharacterized protein n=2 Tax=Meiothermus hypogaeus TaxID=884155 RepID=A0A511QXT4_9DEIN|nr:amino acid ABC transporter permease [Meiothermus hypogaeus]RIH79117.1 hypothetical protein Mhypo_01282 [Meiothermus hypogaeus]GEM82191.1 hypothetical protein MHY01S_03570 [Meiothermus hypogaeus NBRC 106114]GIW38195.1 MAG: hypothetical protein KatS3mg074_593 [Meiothermus sp.]
MSTPKITSIRSVQTYLVAVGLMVMGAVLVGLCVGAWFQGVEPRWSVILFGLLGIYMVLLGVEEGWLSGLEVTPRCLRLQSFGRWQEYPLEGLEAADGLRDILAGGLQLILIGKEREALKVPLRRYRNAGQLAQALLDAAWLHNPDLVVMPRLARRLGAPPFGVLAARKRSGKPQ